MNRKEIDKLPTPLTDARQSWIAEDVTDVLYRWMEACPLPRTQARGGGDGAGGRNRRKDEVSRISRMVAERGKGNDSRPQGGLP